MTHKVNRYKLLCLVLVMWGCCWDYAAAALKIEGIPMAARMVLAKAGELMNQKAYAHAIEQLTAFQARGDTETGDGRNDPRGYHHPRDCLKSIPIRLRCNGASTMCMR